jgi:DNA-directed RNA polymerase specialized sigma24 family protein
VSFEPLKLKLIDGQGRQVPEPVEETVVRAFERAITIPDANIDELVLGAARVARIIADGGAAKPEEYASTVLRRIARRSQRDFVEESQVVSLSEYETQSIPGDYASSSAILAGIEIRRLLDNLDGRDLRIVLMRSRGFRYAEIAVELGMPAVSVRVRYHLAQKRLGKLAESER